MPTNQKTTKVLPSEFKMSVIEFEGMPLEEREACVREGFFHLRVMTKMVCSEILRQRKQAIVMWVAIALNVVLSVLYLLDYKELMECRKKPISQSTTTIDSVLGKYNYQKYLSKNSS